MSKMPSGKPGRKKIIIDADQVEMLAAQGLGIMDICRTLGIGWDTFNKNRKRKKEISDALERGKAKGMKVATTKLMEQIQDGNFQAIQFYLKNRYPDEWCDRQEVKHTLNLKDALTNASARIIQGEVIEQETLNLKDAKD
jgi:GNAT superfamily N-acetyltransferase